MTAPVSGPTIPRRGRPPKAERPKTAAERMAESRARRATEAECARHDLANLVGRLRALAIDAGPLAIQLEGVADQLEGIPPRVRLVGDEVATTVSDRRRALLARFVDLINRAEDDQALDRIERRISIIADMLPAGRHPGARIAANKDEERHATRRKDAEDAIARLYREQTSPVPEVYGDLIAAMPHFI